MKNYEKIGKRWTKGDMDRIYINIDGLAEYNDIPVRNYFNRFQWGNLKVYYDVKKDELVITPASDTAKEAVKAVVADMLKGN